MWRGHRSGQVFECFECSIIVKWKKLQTTRTRVGRPAKLSNRARRALVRAENSTVTTIELRRSKNRTVTPIELRRFKNQTVTPIELRRFKNQTVTPIELRKSKNPMVTPIELRKSKNPMVTPIQLQSPLQRWENMLEGWPSQHHSINQAYMVEWPDGSHLSKRHMTVRLGVWKMAFKRLRWRNSLGQISKHHVWWTPGTAHHLLIPSRIEGRINAAKYWEVLEGDLLQRADNISLGQQFTFQHNNDPKHTVKRALEWLQDKSLTVLEWPSQSPDLNPIEHLWRDLKMTVHRCFPSNLMELERHCWMPGRKNGINCPNPGVQSL